MLRKFLICSAAIVFILSMFQPFLSPAPAQQLPGFEGGISNEMEYMELFVLTGKPIVLKGEIKVKPGTMRNGKRQDQLNLSLESEDKKIVLKRQLTFEVSMEQDSDRRQVIEVSRISRFNENISVKRSDNRTDRYVLDKYELYSSTVTDMAPAVDFYSMNVRGKKVYTINRAEGTVTVDMSGSGVGYEHAWGATETRTMDYIITTQRESTVAGKVYDAGWTGSVQIVESFNRTRELTYISNEPAQMSFQGGYLETIQDEMAARCSYSLPRFDEDGLPLKDRYTKDEVSMTLKTVPTQKRTYIPKIMDISGHWAQQDIEKLLSLGIMAPSGQYFGPQTPANRLIFARGVAELTDIVSRGKRLDEVRSNLTTSKKKTTPAEPLRFDDVKDSGNDVDYVRYLESTGVMQGVGPRKFGPEQNLTRAQAVTIIVRALGLERLAPNPPYSTGFKDEGDIPGWAKDAAYVAREIGLARGDLAGFFRPQDIMTKAEAAAFLNRFITYLQSDLKKDFRDRIFNY